MNDARRSLDIAMTGPNANAGRETFAAKKYYAILTIISDFLRTAVSCKRMWVVRHLRRKIDRKTLACVHR